MDVTPQLIEQIDFSEKFRGYDPDQVDDFLERVGATIAELNNAVRDANIRAERAELMARNAETAAREAQAAAPVAPVAAPMTDEEAVTTAARTLMLAQRTADDLMAAATADADRLRGEAQLIGDAAVRDAQAEADRVLGEARFSADAMVAQARQDADAELVSRRDEIAGEIADLDQCRSTLLGDVALIESRIEGYRDSLDRVHVAIRNLLDDPNALRTQPPLDVADPAPTDAVPFVEATAQEWGAAGESIDAPTPESDPLRSVPEFSSVEAAAPGFFDTPSETADVVVERDDVAPLGDGAFSGPPAAWTEPAVVTGAAWMPEPTGAFSAVDATSTVVEDVAEEPWAPGSWSTMMGEAAPAATGTTLWDDSAFGTASGAVPVAEYVPLPAEPTMDDTFGAPQADRFMRDLDEAVNQPQNADADEAMTAFFEGDDEPAGTTRRFRRR